MWLPIVNTVGNPTHTCLMAKSRTSSCCLISSSTPSNFKLFTDH
jgi:hypothetical protein